MKWKAKREVGEHFYFLLSTSNFGIHRVSPDATADDHEDRRPGTNGAFYFLRLRVWGGEESGASASSKGVFLPEHLLNGTCFMFVLHDLFAISHR